MKKHKKPPFWQTDKPYLHDSNITDERFRWLGYVMALSAGAINAGGFLAVGRYTSHVTGALSSIADEVIVGDYHTAMILAAGFFSYLLGATHTSWIILWAKRQRLHSAYGIAMWVEAFYMTCFGLFGMYYDHTHIPLTLLQLCWIMGMHNTVITIISNGAIRSTHMTGATTDLATELAKMLYYSRKENPKIPDVKVNVPKAELLACLIACFVIGGVIGAWGFRTLGYYFTLPISFVLFLFGYGSVRHDFVIRMKHNKKSIKKIQYVYNNTVAKIKNKRSRKKISD